MNGYFSQAAQNEQGPFQQFKKNNEELPVLPYWSHSAGLTSDPS
jgi:hypothetical protein